MASKVKIFRLDAAHDGVVVQTTSDSDADAIFQTDVLSALEEAGFKAVMPPELRSQRSVICHGLDELAYDNTEAEIKNELEENNPWLKIQEVFKFTSSRTIKITCTSSALAQRALEQGVLMFYLSIPPSQMRIETYIHLTVCDRCHKIESHHTRQCPQPPEYKACSECATIGHNYRECTSKTKKCINCGQGHSCRVMKCSERKKALKEKQEIQRKAMDARTNTTYAGAAKQTPPTPVQNHSSVISTPIELPPYLCLVKATMAEAAVPGTFQDMLSKGLSMNGLPDVKLPPDYSEEIIRYLIQQNETTKEPQPQPSEDPVAETQPEGTSPPSTEPPTPPTHSDTPSDRELNANNGKTEDENEKSEDTTTDEDDMETAAEEDAEAEDAIEIRIYRRQNDPVPKSITYNSFIRAYKKDQFKVVHSGASNDTDRVLDYIRHHQSMLTDNVEFVPDDRYDSLTSGPKDKSKDMTRRQRLRDKL